MTDISERNKHTLREESYLGGGVLSLYRGGGGEALDPVTPTL